MGLSVTQALLRGYGAAVNLIDIRQAELDTQISLYELRGFIESLVSDVETAYWQYVLASRSIIIFERSLEVARQQLEAADFPLQWHEYPMEHSVCGEEVEDISRWLSALIA